MAIADKSVWNGRLLAFVAVLSLVAVLIAGAAFVNGGSAGLEGKQGEQGIPGLPGVSGYEIVRTSFFNSVVCYSEACNYADYIRVSCPVGKKVLSGGCEPDLGHLAVIGYPATTTANDGKTPVYQWVCMP
ncbi:MAG: hypothetical protein AABW54_03745, partial [Candidatus Micrarchaeota archaeon]